MRIWRANAAQGVYDISRKLAEAAFVEVVTNGDIHLNQLL